MSNEKMAFLSRQAATPSVLAKIRFGFRLYLNSGKLVNESFFLKVYYYR
jgi:hypothetical protein